jgi:hypothetical protein
MPQEINSDLFLGMSIRSLFGEFCSGNVFLHDARMEGLRALQSQSSHKMGTESQRTESQMTTSEGRERTPAESSLGTTHDPILLSNSEGGKAASEGFPTELPDREDEEVSHKKRNFDAYAQRDSQSSPDLEVDREEGEGEESVHSDGSPPRKVSSARIEAYRAMVRNASGMGTEGWEAIDLLSTRDAQSAPERQLGDG